MGSSSALKKTKTKNRIPTLLLNHFRKGRKEFIERRQEGEEKGRRVETKTPQPISSSKTQKNPSFFTIQNTTPTHTHTHTHTLKRDCRIYVAKYVLI
jgi:hypothetical protein